MSTRIVNYLELSAPGKLILGGEHSVVFGKKALASAIDLRTRVIAKRRTQASDIEFLQLRLVQLERSIRVSREEFNRLRTYSASAANLSAADLDQALASLRANDEQDKLVDSCRLILIATQALEWSHINGLDIEISSKIPLAAGLGSSASFSVCLAAVFRFMAIYSSTSSETTTTTATTNNDFSFSDVDLEAINSVAFGVERIFHGRPSGIDNSVACYGGYVVFERGVIVDKFVSSLQLPIVVVNSCVPKQTSEQVAKVRQLHSRHARIVDALMDSIHAIVDEFVGLLKSTLTHDSACVMKSHTLIGDLITLNQGILHGLQVDNLELAKIVGIAAKHGFHAKITGSGGGGCCFVLLHEMQGCEDGRGKQSELMMSELAESKFVLFPTKLGCRGVSVEKVELVSS